MCSIDILWKCSPEGGLSVVPLSLLWLPVLLTSILLKYLLCAALSTWPIKILLSRTPWGRYCYRYFIKGKQRSKEVKEYSWQMAKLTFWARVLYGFIFAFGSKSKLMRHINVTPYSLRVSRNLPLACFSALFPGISGSFQALGCESCQQGTGGSSRKGGGDQSKGKGLATQMPTQMPCLEC